MLKAFCPSLSCFQSSSRWGSDGALLSLKMGEELPNRGERRFSRQTFFREGAARIVWQRSVDEGDPSRQQKNAPSQFASLLTPEMPLALYGQTQAGARSTESAYTWPAVAQTTNGCGQR